MEKYIKASEENGNAVLLKFERIKEQSYAQPSPYAYVKKWFLEQYPNYTESNHEQEQKNNNVGVIDERRAA